MAKPRIAIFPGTFDPPTLGHIDIIERAAPLFDTLIVAVLDNLSKRPTFTTSERIAMLRQCAGRVANVRVDVYHGLLVDFARSQDATVIVRGIRGGSDLDYERQMADTNRHLYPGVDTIFLTPSAGVAHISSTLVRDIARLGGSIRGLVPDVVTSAFAARAQSGRTQEV
jgi:pantetheine-phosphate adenylyltransferase